tara:strand:+ start:1545 stop:1973 length:429 start_codon:yes stop_codon:yes gene_type:complete
MADKKECPDCNCPKCPQCPPQITMQDIIRAIMPGRSLDLTYGEFIPTDLMKSATDRWEEQKPDTSSIRPYNPAAQGIMPYSSAIEDQYSPKLDSVDDMFNMEEAIDYKVDEALVRQLKIPGERINAYGNRGNNNTYSITIDK